MAGATAEERQLAVEGVAEDLTLWKQAIALRMDVFEGKLELNTAATERVETNTRELVEILNDWKGAMKVMTFINRLAKPVATITAIGAACMAIWTAWRTGTHP